MSSTAELTALFDGERDRKKTFLYNLWSPGLCALGGFTFAIMYNFTFRRPVFSGIQKHVLFAGIGALIGKTADDWGNEYFAERDATLRHYIELHPEDFPVPEKIKFSEILLPWVPVR